MNIMEHQLTSEPFDIALQEGVTLPKMLEIAGISLARGCALEDYVSHQDLSECGPGLLTARFVFQDEGNFGQVSRAVVLTSVGNPKPHVELRALIEACALITLPEGTIVFSSVPYTWREGNGNSYHPVLTTREKGRILDFCSGTSDFHNAYLLCRVAPHR